MKTGELWHESAVKSAIRTVDLPQGGENQVLIESEYSLISLGTERLVAKGLIPHSISEEMQVPYMEGAFSFPCKYGYSLVGKVIHGPAGYLGRRVHVMHPHQDHAWVDIGSVYTLSEGIPPQRAVLASPLETAINAIWDSEISVGDSILVVGFGLVGALICLVAAGIPGVQVQVHETNENRRSMAAKLGFGLYQEKFPRVVFDKAFNTSADEGGLQLCIDKTGNEGTIIEVSFYGVRQVSVMLGAGYHTGRKRIIASQVSRIPANRLVRWDYYRRKQLVFDLLKNDSFDSLMGESIPFTDSPDFFNTLRKGSIDAISVIINYQQ